jgi:menaquinone-dependent protoporphyrinogen oxidase
MKTLVVYATKHGSAAECAEMLSEKLTGEVDVCNLKEGKVPEVSQYDRVIIGGSIYAGTMHKEVSEFCTKNLDVLKTKKVGLFICCMNKAAVEAQLNNAFPKELLGICTVKDSFGGQFKFSEMNFMEKAITKMVSKTLAKTDSSLPSVGMKNDLSMISKENIDRFARLINAA